MTETSFNKGDRVSFMAGPRSAARAIAKVTGQTTTGEGKGRATFLTTKDEHGKERKVRPGACQSAMAHCSSGLARNCRQALGPEVGTWTRFMAPP